MYALFLDGVQLPIPPADLSLKIQNKNETLNLINDGEINLLKTPGLSEISFEFLLPQFQIYPFSTYPDGFHNAAFYLDKLEKLKTSKQPFQFIYIRTTPGNERLFGINMTVSLEDYEVHDSADEGFDLKVQVNLKQYRAFGTKIIKIQSNTSMAVAVPNRSNAAAPNVRQHKAVRGDCLWRLARRYLGNAARWREIWDLNRSKIRNPNLIYTGQILAIPPR